MNAKQQIKLAEKCKTLREQRNALLAACKRARNHLIMDIDRNGKGIHSNDSPDALRQVKEAIANAEKDGAP